MCGSSSNQRTLSGKTFHGQNILEACSTWHALYKFSNKIFKVGESIYYRSMKSKSKHKMPSVNKTNPNNLIIIKYSMVHMNMIVTHSNDMYFVQLLTLSGFPIESEPFDASASIKWGFTYFSTTSIPSAVKMPCFKVN